MQERFQSRTKGLSHEEIVTPHGSLRLKLLQQFKRMFLGEQNAPGMTAAILMNPNYQQENLALLEAIQAEVRLVEKL